MTNLGQQLGYLQATSNYAHATGQVASHTTLGQAQSSYESALLEARGTLAQLNLQRFSDASNIGVDLTLLSTRQQQLAVSKNLEIYSLVAQTREKVFNLFSTMIENKTSNTWNRLKSAAQGFKY